MKDRILQAYEDNHTELIKMEKYGDIEEAMYCKGYEQALEFIMSLLNIS